jgi:hypothetical protein
MNNFENNLEILSNILQIRSYEILVEDFNNTDLMKYLKHQDELLDTIIEQNKKIISLLKGGKDGYRRNNPKNSG